MQMVYDPLFTQPNGKSTASSISSDNATYGVGIITLNCSSGS